MKFCCNINIPANFCLSADIILIPRFINFSALLKYTVSGALYVFAFEMINSKSLFIYLFIIYLWKWWYFFKKKQLIKYLKRIKIRITSTLKLFFHCAQIHWIFNDSKIVCYKICINRIKEKSVFIFPIILLNELLITLLIDYGENKRIKNKKLLFELSYKFFKDCFNSRNLFYWL